MSIEALNWALTQMQLNDISVPPDNAAEVGRLVAIAKTDLESCVMWATKAVSRFNP